MSTISTSGIAPHSLIKSEHLLRIIDALDGTSPTEIKISSSLSVTGSLYANHITGSLYGTSSYASTASYALNFPSGSGGGSGPSNLIYSGSATASISPNNGLRINTNTIISFWNWEISTTFWGEIWDAKHT